MSLLEQLNQNIAQSGGLIVSRLLPSPLDKPEIVAAMAWRSRQERSRVLKVIITHHRAVVSIPIIGTWRNAISTIRASPDHPFLEIMLMRWRGGRILSPWMVPIATSVPLALPARIISAFYWR